MKTDYEEFKRRVHNIDKIVKNGIKGNGNTDLIYDGIVDIEQYYYTKPRILWILKEPYDDIDENNNPIGGGWSMIDCFLAKEDFFEKIGKANKTWYPIIYASYGILNNYKLWNKEEIITKKMAEVIKKIAMINVQKVPAYTSSVNSTIEAAYHKNKDVLLEQIKVFNPDIIIGGFTLQYFRKALGIDDKFNGIDNEYFGYCLDNSKLYIDTYHPAQMIVSQEVYVNEIIKVAKEKWAPQSK
jgi:hypothetical protein